MQASCFYTAGCNIQYVTLYNINKVTNKCPTEYFCQVTCQLHIVRQPQQERLNSQLVLLSPCCALLRLVTLGASLQPWQPGPQTTMPMSFFTRFMCQHTHWYDGKQYSPCLSLQVRSSQVFDSVISQLNRQRYLVLQSYPSCHWQDCDVSYGVTRELNSVTDQALGIGETQLLVQSKT